MPTIFARPRLRPSLTFINGTVRLLSMNVVVNGKDKALEDGATVHDLVEGLGLKGQPVAVELNLEVVPRTLHGSTVIKEGDRLEVVTLVGGG